MSSLRSSAALALGRATLRAPATELVFWHRASASAPKGCGLLFSFQSLFYLLVSFCTCLVALKLRSLRFHSPRLCRAAVFLIQTNVSLYIHLSPRAYSQSFKYKLTCSLSSTSNPRRAQSTPPSRPGQPSLHWSRSQPRTLLEALDLSQAQRSNVVIVQVMAPAHAP